MNFSAHLHIPGIEYWFMTPWFQNSKKIFQPLFFNDFIHIKNASHFKRNNKEHREIEAVSLRKGQGLNRTEANAV